MKISNGDHLSAVASIMILLIFATSIIFAYLYVSIYLYGYNLVSHTIQALSILMTVQAPLLIVSYSWMRRNSGSCSFLMAVGRGIIGLFIGALVNAFGAIVLGAPVGMKYLTQTAYWSLLMSLFTAVPATCVFGSSRMDWQKYLAFSKWVPFWVFRHTWSIYVCIGYIILHFVALTSISLSSFFLHVSCRPMDIYECMVFLPAYGSLIGAWIGAWPMPLDWDMPWQEWPICVTHGAVAGYLVGLLASLVYIFIGRKKLHVKDE